MFCPDCGLRQPDDHRFCVSCGKRLPAELLHRRGPKVSRWFWAVPVAPSDPANAALRVSRYVESVEVATEDGRVRLPSHHVRFSIWHEDHAACAISLPDDEASALASFLQAEVARATEDAAASGRG